MATNPLEKLSRLFQVGPRIMRQPTNKFAGRTTLNSGSTTVTVSTTAVRSNSMILTGMQVSSVGVATNSGGVVVVNSIVHGTSFALARATGVAVPWNTVVSWEIIQID